MNKPQIITKIVPLRFVNTSIAQANISVPFRVKEIVTKTIIYEDDADPVPLPQYGLVVSNLVREQPLGVFMSDYRFASYSGSDNIVYKSQNPIDIAGSYTFNLKSIDNTTFTLSGSMVIILEFTEAEQTALTN
jgi:hypothetical protein